MYVWWCWCMSALAPFWFPKHPIGVLGGSILGSHYFRLRPKKEYRKPGLLWTVGLLWTPFQQRRMTAGRDGILPPSWETTSQLGGKIPSLPAVMRRCWKGVQSCPTVQSSPGLRYLRCHTQLNIRHVFLKIIVCLLNSHLLKYAHFYNNIVLFAKLHANTTVCFLAIVNIREERGGG